MRKPHTKLAFAILAILTSFFLVCFLRDIQVTDMHANNADFTHYSAPLPEFHVANLLDPNKILTERDLYGHVCLLNIWASWCSSCYREHALLETIASRFHVPIYSLNFQDGSIAAKAWLGRYGNPYVAIGMDTSGSVARKMGVYGTPQTFLIDKQGIIRYQHIGILTQTDWDMVLWPLVQQYQNN